MPTSNSRFRKGARRGPSKAGIGVRKGRRESGEEASPILKAALESELSERDRRMVAVLLENPFLAIREIVKTANTELGRETPKNASREFREPVRLFVKNTLAPLARHFRGKAPEAKALTAEVVEEPEPPEPPPKALTAYTRKELRLLDRAQLLSSFELLVSEFRELGKTNPQLLGPSIEGQLRVMKEIARAIGADRPEPEKVPEVPVFLGVPRSQSIEEFCDDYGYAMDKMSPAVEMDTGRLDGQAG